MWRSQLASGLCCMILRRWNILMLTSHLQFWFQFALVLVSFLLFLQSFSSLPCHALKLLVFSGIEENNITNINWFFALTEKWCCLVQSVAQTAEDIWDSYGYEFGTEYSGLFKALSHVNYNVRMAAAEALAAALDENPDTIQVGFIFLFYVCNKWLIKQFNWSRILVGMSFYIIFEVYPWC